MTEPDPSLTPPEPMVDPDVPPMVRGLAAVAALLLGVFAVQLAWGALQRGYPWTAGAWVVAGAPLVAFFGAVGLAPGPMQAHLGSWTSVDLREEGHVVTLAVLGLTLFFVYGLGGMVETTFALETLAHGGSLEEITSVSQSRLLVNLVMTLLLFMVPPVMWLVLVDRRAADEVPGRLGWRSQDLILSAGVGLAIAVAAIVLLAVVAFTVEALGVTLPTNERAEALAAALTLPTAFLVSAVAAVGEEVFFRGWLQPRIGLVPQAVLFSLAHLSYLNVLELVVTFLLGLAFGVAMRRTDNLAAPVAGHFFFNFIMLVLFLLVPAVAL